MTEIDTVAAIATPPGRGGVGMLRLSGPDAAAIARQLAHTRRPLAGGRVRYGSIVDETGQRVDDALVTLFPAPHSYTGEDVVEISTHGSPVVLEWLLRAALRHGARLARPGEFTERAFLRGRLDLTAAEAVRDLIDAQTLAQAKVAAEQIGGALAGQVRPWKQELIELVAALEAGIDFAEDDIDTLPFATIRARIDALLAPLEALLSTFHYGRILREGLRLAIVGRPNAGKSSLFNRLVERERAIVAASPGTTRDVVAERISLGGIPIELLDTAGLRETTDEIERIGIARSREAIAEADLVLMVTDAREGVSLSGSGTGTAIAAAGAGLRESAAAAWEEELNLVELLRGRPALRIRNKIDLLSATERGAAHPQTIATSALTGEGIPELRTAILEAAGASGAAEANRAILTNTRQHDSIARAVLALQRAGSATQVGTPHEMLLLDLYETLQALDELTGQTTPDDILDRIFSTFCIGK